MPTTYTEEDRYNDKFEYQRSFHYRPDSGPRVKHNERGRTWFQYILMRVRMWLRGYTYLKGTRF